MHLAAPLFLTITLLLTQTLALDPSKIPNPCGEGTFNEGNGSWETAGECKRVGLRFYCRGDTTVTIKQSQVILRAGPADSTVHVVCGKSKKVFHCSAGQTGEFRLLPCKHEKSSVANVREISHGCRTRKRSCRL